MQVRVGTVERYERSRDTWTVLSATVGCAALAVYAAVKANWAMGGDVGVRDDAGWESDLGGLSQGQLFGALWGTVLLDLLGVVLLVALVRLRGTSRRGPLVRVLRGAAWLGGVGLTLAGLAGLVVTIGPLTGWWSGGSFGPLQVWVFLSVYGAFLVVGAALLATAALTRGADRTPSVPAS